MRIEKLAEWFTSAGWRPFAQQQRPIIVKIVEPTNEPSSLAHLVYQAVGFTGAVALLAVLLGLLLAAVMVWARSRRAQSSNVIDGRRPSRS